MYVHLGSDVGHSAATSHSAEQRFPALDESVHNALSQSASPTHGAPTPPSPRAPGTQYTCSPVSSSEWQVKVGPQSSDEKHGQSVFVTQAPPSQKREREPPSG